jgi:hypothetical protein
MKVSDFLTKLQTSPPTSIRGFLDLLGNAEFRGDTTFNDATRLIETYAKPLVQGMAMNNAFYWIKAMCKADGRSPYFVRLNTNTVACQLVLRVFEPHRFNQEEFGTCGPAAFCMLMAQSRPEKLTRFAADLLSDGKSTVNGWEIAPNDEILKYDPDKAAKMVQADWLLLASLRLKLTAEELAVGKEKGRVGGTDVEEMFKWLCKFGYQTVCGFPTDQVLPKGGVMGAVVKAAQLIGFAQPMFAPRKPGFLNRIDPIAAMEPRRNLNLLKEFAQNRFTLFLCTSEAITKQCLTGNDAIVAAKDKDYWKDKMGAELPEGFVMHMGGGPKTEVQAAGAVNHWLLLTAFDVSPNSVAFEGFSWGLKCKGSVPLETFLTDYGGFVAVNSRDLGAVEQDWKPGEN